MKSLVLSVIATLALLSATATVRAQELPELPEMPKPQKEHAWLQQFVGQWESEAEMFMEGQPVAKSKGTETVRKIGGFWIQSEQQSDFMGQPFTGLMTLGYDVPKQQYVGTWIDSHTGYLWVYEGTLDRSGKVLTLEAEGPCPMAPGRMSKFKEVLEVKDKDHKVFTSSIQGEDGTWTTGMRITYRRKS